jgi:hypothetical protein
MLPDLTPDQYTYVMKRTYSDSFADTCPTCTPLFEIVSDPVYCKGFKYSHDHYTVVLDKFMQRDVLQLTHEYLLPSLTDVFYVIVDVINTTSWLSNYLCPYNICSDIYDVTAIITEYAMDGDLIPVKHICGKYHRLPMPTEINPCKPSLYSFKECEEFTQKTFGNAPYLLHRQYRWLFDPGRNYYSVEHIFVDTVCGIND